MIDSVGLEDFSSSDSIPSSLDDLIPQAFKPESEEEKEDERDEDEFEGFNFDLDSIADDTDSEKNNDDDDDDITSLFDSMFDE